MNILTSHITRINAPSSRGAKQRQGDITRRTVLISISSAPAPPSSSSLAAANSLIMSRPPRTSFAASGPGSNPNRRFSQPAFPSQAGRRVSEVSGISRADTLPSSMGGGPPEDKSPPRKGRVGKDAPEPGIFDPEKYNPDGSLRTMHRIPSFNDAYAEAAKARYIRHKELIDREKELTIKQIFDKNS